MLSQTASAVERALEAEGSARERADVLLQIDAVSWSGGPFTVVPIERLLEKTQRAVQAPDSLEKQITLLATEDEARRLGLGDLIAAWSKEGLRYQDVSWTAEAAFYRSAAAHLLPHQPAPARHAGSTPGQVRTLFQALDN